jgi:hypothetical protein
VGFTTRGLDPFDQVVAEDMELLGYWSALWWNIENLLEMFSKYVYIFIYLFI